MKIILFQPQIPQNTGNIIRTSAVTGCELVLVKPFGFSLSDRYLKRAGLDYFENISLEVIDDLYAYLEKTSENFYFFSSHATKIYWEVKYTKQDYLIFGSETAGLDPKFLLKWKERFVKIPMLPEKRCLNLATSVGIATYEVLRQVNFSSSFS